jgi:hypothetical protein
MYFQIIVISHNQAEFIEPMSSALDNQFYGINVLFVLDRCQDNSADILKKLDKKFIENKEGEGFLAGKARDLGLSFLGVNNTLFLDGDRIPVNFSIDLVNKSIEFYDVCLVSVEKDFRKNFSFDFVPNPNFSKENNDVFSCGICIRKEMIERITKLQGGRLFNIAFDGVFGEEDRFLGSVVNYFGGSCGLYPKTSYLKGGFTKIINYRRYLEQVNKRKKLVKELLN